MEPCSGDGDMSLTDEKIGTRKPQGAVRIGPDRAVVEVEARILTLIASDKDEANKSIARVFGEHCRIVDLLEVIRAGSSVSQAADDLAAIQTILPNATQAPLGRTGIAIIRALLGV